MLNSNFRSLAVNRGRRLRITWVDDLTDSVRMPATKLRALGHQVQTLSPEQDNVLKAAARSDVVVLDLNWDHADPTKRAVASSIELVRALTKVKKVPAVVYTSAFFASAKYANIEQQVSPLVCSKRVDKEELSRFIKSNLKGGDVEVGNLNDQLHRVHAEAQQRAARLGGALPGPKISDAEAEVFGVDPDTYFQLSLDEKIKILQRVSAIVGHLVDEAFESTEADWLIVGETPPTILGWGSGEGEPSDDDLEVRSRTLGSVVFYFSRPIVFN